MALFELIKHVKKHPVISIAAALVLGFSSGFGAREVMLKSAGLDTVAHGTVVDRAELEHRQRDLASCEATIERRKPLLEWCRDIAGQTLQKSIDAELKTTEVKK